MLSAISSYTGPSASVYDDARQVGLAQLRRHQLQLLAHANARKDAGALERARHAQAAALRDGLVGNVLPVDEHAPARGLAPAGNSVHQRRLAGAVRADHAVQHTALRHLEVHALERLHAAVGHAQVFNAQHGRSLPCEAHARRA
jgi:hypothetical protein